MLAVRVNNLLATNCFSFDSYSTVLAKPCRVPASMISYEASLLQIG
jgi:hypothetical protein